MTASHEKDGNNLVCKRNFFNWAKFCRFEESGHEEK